MRIRDNGRGIDPEVLKHGRSGHWGLPGMRERARNVRANLEIWSRPGAGTEIELSLQAELAYRRGRRGARWRWWRLAPPAVAIARIDRSREAVTEHE
jgi:signal transduction histidine kinase